MRTKPHVDGSVNPISRYEIAKKLHIQTSKEANQILSYLISVYNSLQTFGSTPHSDKLVVLQSGQKFTFIMVDKPHQFKVLLDPNTEYGVYVLSFDGRQPKIDELRYIIKVCQSYLSYWKD